MSLGACQAVAATLLFRNARVFDGVRMLTETDVLVRDGRIEADKLLVKCPSKYQGSEMKTYGAEPAPPRKTS